MKKKGTMIWTAVVLATAILAAVNFAYRAVITDLHETIDEEIGTQLSGLAESFAAAVDPDVVRGALAEEESFSASDYMRVWEATRDFALANRLVSVTILDTLWRDPFGDESDSLAIKIYSLLDRESEWALKAGLPWVSDTYSWEGGFYRSAAAPITDTSGTVTIGMVRLEADAGYFTSLSRLRTLAWWIHGLSALLAITIVSLFVWYSARTRRWQAELLRSEKLIGLGRLSATIAHEIKNPLGIIKATAQRLQKIEGAGSPEHRAELLRFIPEEADRLNRILGRYLAIADPTRSRAAAVSMEERLPQWLEQVPRSEGADGSWYELSVDPTGPIWADPESPRQTLLNLVHNALEASPDEAKVQIRWEKSGDSFGQLVVADRGPGIPRGKHRRIFEPFYTTKAQGSGLGLYAVQMMVERDGGTVAVTDNPGGGTKFIVRWPLAVQQTASDTESG